MPKGHNDFVATPQLNQFGAAYTPLDETNYSGAQSAGANVFGGGINESTAAGQGQASLAQMLANQANGQGPSLAQGQLQSALAQGQKQAAGAIAAQRGINPALGARLIGNQQAQQAMTAAGQSALLRSQEQLNAQNALGNVLAQQRQGAQGQAGLGQNLFAQSGQLQNAQNATRLQNGLGTQQLNLQAALANQQALMGAQQINSGTAQQNTNAQNAIAGNVLGAVGAVAGGALGGPLGAAAGSAAGGALGGGNGGDITMAPVKLAQGGAVPASPSGTDLPSFAEMVASHIVRLDGERHALHTIQTPMAKGGMVKARSETLTKENVDEKPRSANFKAEDEMSNEDFDKALNDEEPKKMADGGPVPSGLQLLQGGGSASGGLEAYQAAIRNGASAMDAFKSLSDDDKKALARASGNPTWAMPQNWDKLARSLDPVNQAISIPAAQRQQQSLGVQEFNPGNFGGLATSYMNHDVAPSTPVNSAAPGGIGAVLAAFGHGAAAKLLGQGTMPGGAGTVTTPAPGQVGPSVATPAPKMDVGGRVPGKAVKPGDHEDNDTVPALLSPGEIVIPRSLATKPAQAKRFIEHLMEQQREKGR